MSFILIQIIQEKARRHQRQQHTHDRFSIRNIWSVSVCETDSQIERERERAAELQSFRLCVSEKRKFIQRNT